MRLASRFGRVNQIRRDRPLSARLVARRATAH